MTELEKLKAGLEYCYDDPEVEALKERAILFCREYNAIDWFKCGHNSYATPLKFIVIR